MYKSGVLLIVLLQKVVCYILERKKSIYLFQVLLEAIAGMAQRVKVLTLFFGVGVRILVPAIFSYLGNVNCASTRATRRMRIKPWKMECEVGSAGRQADGSDLRNGM
jgi:hypothetical protein